ncbi:isoaspartyl peptidase/L-asparaginase [Pontibacter sp. G13]|uniref:isoaspartyl peptidase/L-asparaginase family protein n=1 Tax=Pontibacter sp. G13 TaxID=3074898 RepID=UPI00288A31C8|nr:isoaspartyl peptidase/L-asparaginase [Pontibacter sp. G13]WNJ18577.1 isoaspartyl peptidase/L-asparaginase [Pontibacter sp. G13]
MFQIFITILILMLSQTPDSPAERPDFVLVIHGGAGTIKKELMTPELEAEYRAGLQAALDAGKAVLEAGGSAEDAVEAAILPLEDNPLFNAGKGAVFTHEKTVELDASFMSGKTGEAGAISGVKTVKHPIRAARKVMEESVHVMLTGTGAEAFAQVQGLEMVENSYFYTERREKQLDRILAREAEAHETELDDPNEPVRKKHGTVGAVALDKYGNLAAGTSTGGMTNKRYGRVGDSPIIGAGTYADNATCAVSCTGHGEYYIRNVVAFDVSARMKYQGSSLQTASDQIIHEVLKEQGGTGGLIAVDKDGHIAMPFNTSGMFRGYVKSTGEQNIGIYQ